MKRQIIHIDQEKCNGCGACAAACHEVTSCLIGVIIKVFQFLFLVADGR